MSLPREELRRNVLIIPRAAEMGGDVSRLRVARGLWQALVVCALVPGLALAQGSSDEGAVFLLLPYGADAVGLGRAVTAMPGQESAFWNPAGLASLDHSRLLVLRSGLAIGNATGASLLFARPGVGSVGISYLLLNAGDQDYKDSADNLIGSISVRNHLAVVSAAAEVLPRVDVGVNFKLIQFRLGCRGACGGVQTSSTGYAVDAGIQLEPVDRVPVRLGAMVAHFGPAFQLENASQADPLPTRVRFGVAYDVLSYLEAPDLKGWVTIEVQDRLGAPGDPSLYMGSEVSAGIGDAIFLRAGYATDADQPGGLSVGLGLRRARYEISVAKWLASATLPGENEPFSVSLSVGL